MNILITAANSVHAQQLKNKLDSANIILGDYFDLPSFMLGTANMITLPNPESVSYAHEMLTVCLDKNITTIYLLRNKEIECLSVAKQLFNEYGIELVHGI